jgi:hypothetical protein
VMREPSVKKPTVPMPLRSDGELIETLETTSALIRRRRRTLVG